MSVDRECVEEAQSKCNLIIWIMSKLCMLDVYTMVLCVFQFNIFTFMLTKEITN